MPDECAGGWQVTEKPVFLPDKYSGGWRTAEKSVIWDSNLIGAVPNYYLEEFMNILKIKLSSRKLWTAIAGMVMGISMVFGLDEAVISTIAGAVVSIVSVVSYIYMEGKIDAAAVSQLAMDIEQIIEIIDEIEE